MGTILPYVGELDKIPKKWHLCDGMEGTPNLLDGKFLEGSITPNTIHDAGLPDIFLHDVFQGFNIGGSNQTPLRLYGTDSASIRNATNTAKQANPLYGKSNTVQPYSYTVFYIMKIKI